MSLRQREGKDVITRRGANPIPSLTSWYIDSTADGAINNWAWEEDGAGLSQIK